MTYRRPFAIVPVVRAGSVGRAWSSRGASAAPTDPASNSSTSNTRAIVRMSSSPAHYTVGCGGGPAPSRLLTWRGRDPLQTVDVEGALTPSTPPHAREVPHGGN